MFSLFKKGYRKLPRPIRFVVIIIIVALIISSICVVAGAFVNGINRGRQTKYQNNIKQKLMFDIGLQNESGKIQEFAQARLKTNFKIEFLNVGQADCAVITNGVSTMMVDTANAEDAKYILEHLKDNNIEKINYLVCTNESDEHIGGLLEILENIQVETLIIPNAYTENEFMRRCVKRAASNCTAVREATPLDAWNLDEAQCIILQNNGNVILKVSMQNIATLFLSDATPEEEMSLLDLELDISANFLKASGHGAINTANDKLLQKVKVEHAIVSCDESVAKPDIDTMLRLYKRAIVSRTDRQDTIVVTTDGVLYKLDSTEINCNG